MEETDTRTDLEEARAILDGSSYLLAEVRHLRALEDAHQNEICKIAAELHQLSLQILRRN